MIEDLINRGTNNNVIVYDGDAPDNRFSKRLIFLMKHHFFKSFDDELTQILVPPETLNDLLIDTELFNSFRGHNIFEGFTVSRIKIKPMDKNYTQWFKDALGGTTGSDNYIVVGHNGKGEVLLGSF